MSDGEDEVSENESDVHHRDIFQNAAENPSTELVTAIAELKGVDQDELDPLYPWADGLISDLYSSPPGPDSQVIVEFTYEGFRITLYQDGQAVLMRRSTSED